MTAFDSRPDTYAHIQQVQHLLNIVIRDFLRRAEDHDQSKLAAPEVAAFDEFTPQLASSTYGSDEYKGFLAAMRPALAHHYAVNRHHPEHYPRGIQDMTLLDVVEMLCDWKAAVKRHATGSIDKSLEINQQRFGYSDELKQLFYNTVRELERLEDAP
jgi:hypothetical protein